MLNRTRSPTSQATRDARRSSLRPEIVLGLDQATAEIFLPDAIGLAAVLVEQREQLLFAFLPVDLLFDVGETAGIADSFGIDRHRADLTIGRVLEFWR